MNHDLPEDFEASLTETSHGLEKGSDPKADLIKKLEEGGQLTPEILTAINNLEASMEKKRSPESDALFINDLKNVVVTVKHIAHGKSLILLGVLGVSAILGQLACIGGLLDLEIANIYIGASLSAMVGMVLGALISGSEIDKIILWIEAKEKENIGGKENDLLVKP